MMKHDLMARMEAMAPLMEAMGDPMLVERMEMVREHAAEMPARAMPNLMNMDPMMLRDAVRMVATALGEIRVCPMSGGR